MTPCFVACPTLCIFCLYMFAQSTDLFDQLPSWVPVGRDSLGGSQDTAWFSTCTWIAEFFFSSTFCICSCRLNSLNYSVYGSPTVSQLYSVFSYDEVMIFVYMTRLQLARCQWCTLYVFGAHCRSLWLDTVGRELVLPDGVFCLLTVTPCSWNCSCRMQDGLWDCVVRVI
jgi:hypothetical protein